MAATKTKPKGGKPDKIIRHALMLAVAREIAVVDEKTQKAQKFKALQLMADAMVREAIAGNVAAFNAIADRLDGKVLISNSSGEGAITLEDLVHASYRLGKKESGA